MGRQERASSSLFSSPSNLRWTFLTSSAGGRVSGFTPRSINILRTAILFSTCSLDIRFAPDKSFSITLVAGKFGREIFGFDRERRQKIC